MNCVLRMRFAERPVNPCRDFIAESNLFLIQCHLWAQSSLASIADFKLNLQHTEKYPNNQSNNTMISCTVDDDHSQIYAEKNDSEISFFCV